MNTTSTQETAHTRIPYTVGMLAWNSGDGHNVGVTKQTRGGMLIAIKTAKSYFA